MNEHLADEVSRDRPLRVLLIEDSRFDAELLRENLLACYPRADLHVVRDEAGFGGALADGGFDRGKVQVRTHAEGSHGAAPAAGAGTLIAGIGVV